MLLSKNISKLDLSELLKYLDQLHELIMEERTMALTAYAEVQKSVAQMIADSGGDVDTVVHLLGNSPAMASQSKLAGEASARLVKIAEIKSKVLMAMMRNEAEHSGDVLSEDDKQKLLEEASRETHERKTGTAS
jgi:hypothetical protein